MRKETLLYTLVSLWFLFTFSLTGWWYVYARGQLNLLTQYENIVGEEVVRRQQMLLSEGITLAICLLLGAIGLSFLIYASNRERKRVEAFFSTFSHELRTPLASLQLQAESLREEQGKKHSDEICSRLIDDARRLGIQLENCLGIAQMTEKELYLEKVPLSDFFHWQKQRWPQLSIVSRLKKDEYVIGDRNALESIFSNLFQNAIQHGDASVVTISVDQLNSEHIGIRFEDNGSGFCGERKSLGNMFYRPTSKSGNGVGLAIATRLAHLMKGSLQFPGSEKGFVATLQLQGSRL